MWWITALALGVLMVLATACNGVKTQAPQPSGRVGVVLHNFWKPTAVTLTIGPRTVFKDVVEVTEATTAVAKKFDLNVTAGERVCVALDQASFCRTVTAADAKRSVMLVSPANANRPLIEFVDFTGLD